MLKATRPPSYVIAKLADGTRLVFRGQVAQILYLLVKSPRGLTSIDVWPSSTLGITTRLAGKIHELRKHGLQIETAKELNSRATGWHARYILRTPVDLTF